MSLSGAILVLATGGFLAVAQTQPPKNPPPQQSQTPQASPTPGRQVRVNPEVQKVKPAGEEKRVQPDDIDKLLAAGDAVLLDIREDWEIEELGTREGYINIPLAELPVRLNELPKDKAILPA